MIYADVYARFTGWMHNGPRAGTLRPSEAEVLGVDPAQRPKDTPVVAGIPDMNRYEAYAQVDAERAQKEKESMAELAGYWAGCDGKPRVCPITNEQEAALESFWLRGFDNGAAAKRAEVAA